MSGDAKSGGEGPDRIILCADDYALTEGVSRAIETLAEAGRLSAASVMVTTRHWPAHGARARALRKHVAVGLHIDLTLGPPLGPMPRLAPDGRLPAIGALSRRALAGDIDRAEIATEVLRQIDAFAAAVGHPPDFYDGHQHAHALPRIRHGVLDALDARRHRVPALVRDPADSFHAILRRGTALAKSATLRSLAHGFGAAARRAGHPTNDSFAGVTDFAPGKTEADFARAAIGGGRTHLVMCHPGLDDDELRALDPVTARRQRELDLLQARDVYGAVLWRPRRAPDGPPIDWRAGRDDWRATFEERP